MTKDLLAPHYKKNYLLGTLCGDATRKHITSINKELCAGTMQNEFCLIFLKVYIQIFHFVS